MRKEIVVNIGLLLLISILAWNVYHLRSEREQLRVSLETYNSLMENPIYQDPALSALADSTLPSYRFTYLNQEGELTSTDVHRKPHLFVVFSPDDCLACFKEVPFWERIDMAFGDQLTVVGIVSGASKEKSTSFINARRIDIPVAYDPDDRLMEVFQVSGTGLTPVKALINTEGKVLHIARTTYDNAIAQMRYSRALQSLLDDVASGG